MERIKSCVKSKVGRLKGGKGLSKKETKSRKSKQSNENDKTGYEHRNLEVNLHNELFPTVSLGDNPEFCIMCDDALDTIFKTKGSSHVASKLSGTKETNEETVGEDARKVQGGPLTVYECEVCSAQCCSLPTYRKHLVEKHNENKELLKKMCFPCSFCAETFFVQSALWAHQRLLHNIFTLCPVCSESFETQDLFVKHMGEKHHDDCIKNGEMIFEYDEGYFCKACGVCSQKYDYVTTHLKEAHSDNISFECELCKLKFETKRNLVRHINSFHKEKLFCCKLCGEGFIHASHLRVHRRRKRRANSSTGIRTEGKMDCKLCGKVFANAAAYRVHHVAVHQGKQFQCMACRKSFNARTMLYRHKITAVCKKGKSIPEPCPICGNILENYVSLRCHKINIHKFGNTKETVCHVCNKRFKSPNNLLKHNKVHHGIKKMESITPSYTGFMYRRPVVVGKPRMPQWDFPYDCYICGKITKDTESLKSHLRLSHK